MYARVQRLNGLEVPRRWWCCCMDRFCLSNPFDGSETCLRFLDMLICVEGRCVSCLHSTALRLACCWPDIILVGQVS